MNFNKLLQRANQMNASDIHLVPDCLPMLRIDGTLFPVENEVATIHEETNAILHLMTKPGQRDKFQRDLELDFTYVNSEGLRFRVNACSQQGTVSLTLRRLTAPPTVDEMNLPHICKDLAKKKNGIVLVAGPTGSGKSTTLAAMVSFLNRTTPLRVVTIEDPIEYVFTSEKCLISQRELGMDTHSFANALKHALRQDPDVILVGEIRDAETASMALMAAETGHLVLTTGHASSAPVAIERIIDLFPTHQQPLAQTRMASVIEGVLHQTLVPRAYGSGRLPAVEIMLGTTAVRNIIREGKLHLLPNVLRTGTKSGMCSIEDALVRLFNAGLINRQETVNRCPNLEDTMATERKSNDPVSVHRQR